MSNLISFALETLWWLFFAFVFGCVAVNALWEHRPWRKRERTFREDYEEIVARGRRTYEAEALAEMERRGAFIWRPDPQRVKADR